MKEFLTILIADRNSHVRMFLLRELMAEGYRVKMAATGENVLKMAYARDDIDLLILDPDLPGIDLPAMLNTLADRIPVLPVVLHTHRRYDEALFLNEDPWVTIIEKDGDSVERIKAAVGRLLRSSTRGISEATVHGCPEGKTSWKDHWTWGRRIVGIGHHHGACQVTQPAADASTDNHA